MGGPRPAARRPPAGRLYNFHDNFVTVTPQPRVTDRMCISNGIYIHTYNENSPAGLLSLVTKGQMHPVYLFLCRSAPPRTGVF